MVHGVLSGTSRVGHSVSARNPVYPKYKGHDGNPDAVNF